MNSILDLLQSAPIISFIIAGLALLCSIYFFKKNRELSKIIFEYQKQKDVVQETEKKKDLMFKNVKLEKESQEYFEYIKNQFEYLDFTGLNAILLRPIPLESIYVKLKIVKTPIVKEYNTIQDFDVVEKQNTEVGEAFLDSLKYIFENRLKIRDPIRMLIVGHPGSGKTTLMKWIALQCLNPKNDLLYNHIPVFIPLKNFGKDPNNTFRKYNIRNISMRILEANNISTDFLKDSFNSNRILFLLDGLDEIADEALRREIIEWIQAQNILRSLVIITSRFSGINIAKGITFNSSVTVYEIENFSIEDIQSFLENWYRNVELAITDLAQSSIALKRAEEKSTDLIKVITDPSHRSLLLLAINPLLLTIIAIVHRTKAVLPKERHKLYEESIKVMVELWHISNKRLDLNFTFENSISHLSSIAVYLMKNNTRELTEVEIKKNLPSLIEGKPVESFLNEMILKSGLIYSSEGKYGFLHLTFQEYLAARYFERSVNQNAILEYIDKDFWIETIRLFVNIGNTHIFFTELIERVKTGNFKNLSFVLELAQEIVVEEDKQKYVGEALNLLAPQLLNLKNSKEDSKRIFEVFYPSVEVYLNYTNKIESLFWNVVKNAENNFAKSIGVLILFNSTIESQKNLSENLKSEIQTIEGQFKSFEKDFERIEKEKKKLIVTEAKKKVEDQIIALETYTINIYFITFNFFSVHSRRIDDLVFIVKSLKSNVLIIQYLAIVALRDYKQLEDIVQKLEINKLSIIKPLQDQNLTFNASTEKIKNLNNLLTPKNFSEIVNEEKFLYWKELRPSWQQEQMQQIFNEKKSILKDIAKEINSASDKIENALLQLTEEDKKRIFIND